jgi:hypothetical protein
MNVPPRKEKHHRAQRQVSGQTSKMRRCPLPVGNPGHNVESSASLTEPDRERSMPDP